MERWARLLGVLATLAATVACGTTGFDPSLPDLVIPDPAEQVEESTERSGSLESFFDEGTEPATPVLSDSSEGAGGSPAPAADETEPTTEPEPDPDPTAGVSAETSDDEPAPDSELSRNAELEAEPSQVLLAATHTIMVTGDDFPPGAEVIVAGCQIGGDPIDTDMTAATLVERASAITPAEACDLAGSEQVTVGDDGSFTAEIDVEVGPTTAIVAGGANAPFAVFTPIYLES